MAASAARRLFSRGAPCRCSVYSGVAPRLDSFPVALHRAAYATVPIIPAEQPKVQTHPIDTHVLVKDLQRSGMVWERKQRLPATRAKASCKSLEQAEILTASIKGILCDTLARLSAQYATHTEAEKNSFQMKMVLDTFKSEMKSLVDMNAGNTKRETELARGECEKLRTELRYEIDKIAASQRLDLNLEKGRIRDELQTQNSRSMAVEVRLDKEVNAVRTALEANKNDIIRYCVGTIVSISAVGLGLLRLVI